MAIQETQVDTRTVVTNPITTKSPMEWNDVKTLYERHRDSMHKYLNTCLKDYFMYSQDRFAQLQKDKETWRTNIKSPLTHMYVNGVYNMLQDSDIRWVAIDKKGDQAKASNAMLSLAEYTYEQEESHDAVWSALFDTVLGGFGYFKTSYMYKKYDVEVMTKEFKKEKIEEKIDHAVWSYVSPYNLVTLGAKNTGDTRMIIERRLIPASKLELNYLIYTNTLNETRIKEIHEKGTYVDDKDHEAIKENIPFYNNTEGRDIYEDSTYNIKDKMMECFELHTDVSMSLWINSAYIGTWPSLGPIKRIKTYETSFKKIPGMNKGTGVAYVVKPIQDTYDDVLNMRVDNVKLSMNKIFFIDQGSNAFGNATTMKIRPGAIYKVRDPNSIREFVVSEVKSSAFTELDSMFTLTQGLVGISAPGLGIQQKVERTAAGAEILKNAADNQLKPLLRSVSRAMSRAMKDMVILSLYYMDDDTLENVCGKEEAAALKELDIQEIIKSFDFSFEMTSQSSESKAIQRQQLQTALQTAQTITDAGGLPAFDIVAIAKKYMDTFDLDVEADMTPQKYITYVRQGNDTRKQLQDAGQQIPGADGQPVEGAPANGAPTGGAAELEAMRSLSQIPGAGVPAEMNTNPQGAN